MATIKRFVHEERGADLIEYALIAGLISMAAYAVISPLGPSIVAMLDKISSKVSGINP